MSMKNPLQGYKYKIGKRAEKALKTFDDHVVADIFQKLDDLVGDKPHSLNIIKLKGYDDFYRISFGSYRIVYEPEHKVITIHVIFVGTRQAIYKEFKRLIG